MKFAVQNVDTYLFWGANTETLTETKSLEGATLYDNSARAHHSVSPKAIVVLVTEKTVDGQPKREIVDECMCLRCSCVESETR